MEHSDNDTGPSSIEHPPEAGEIDRKEPSGKLRLYTIGLLASSPVYLVITPMMIIPSTFDPRQFCGVPLIGFVCVGIPIIMYGLLRWLTFPYIRPTARNFHIAGFTLDMISVSLVILPILATILSRGMVYWSGYSKVRGCLMIPFGAVMSALPVGAIAITIWSFFSMGPVRKRGTGLIAWVLVLLYIIALFGYIVYSRLGDDAERYPRWSGLSEGEYEQQSGYWK